MRRAGIAAAVAALTCLAMIAPVLAETPPPAAQAFRDANERYRHDDFSGAAAGYAALLAQGVRTGPLYFNAGNAYLKLGRPGEALWAYLKAGALLPRDADVQANADYARSLAQPGVNMSVQPSRLVRWAALRQQCTATELAGWAALWLWAMTLAWSLALWLPRVRRIAAPAAWVSGLAAAVWLTALLAQTLGIDAVPRAVVIREQVDAKFSPQAGGTTHFTLSEGAVVRVLGRGFGWTQVSRGDGRSGWASDDALMPL